MLCYLLIMITVGISLHFQDTYDKEVTLGIIEFAKGQPQWRLSGPIGGLSDSGMRKEEQLDALITRIEHINDLKHYKNLHIPIIDIAGAFHESGIYSVQNDDESTGKKAGDFIRDMGVYSVAYCGVKDASWSSQRLNGFSKSIGKPFQEIPSFTHTLGFYKNQKLSKALYKFLQGLAIPTAIFCCNDIVALKVTRHILDLGYQIPSQLSVVSVDNDPLLCTLATPTLTSVALNCFSIGYKAASTVLKLLEDKKDEVETIALISPLEVVERESTQIFLTHDEVVDKGLIFIKEHVNEGINVEDVIKVSATSRRNLEIKWKKARGKTILSDIIEQRMKVAKRLLRETNATIESIALECGFNTSQRFYAIFKREVGFSPKKWREMSKKAYR
ncbi:MAG: helix-turn-helix domain-containing protein [Spirochaetia bacterium]|nr:helix-turn-helix domain-containing protein [Spirochaetia bacterium]